MENPSLKKVIVILPAYNEQNTIISVLDKIPASLPGIAILEILVVDDGSSDNTVKLVRENNRARIISHGENRGVGAAFHSGIEYALNYKADAVVTIDADGQFDPADIAKLLEPVTSGRADFVTASRFVDAKFLPDMPAAKLWGNRMVAKLISWIAKKKFYDVSCGFRAYSREALLRLNLFGAFTYTQEVFLDLSFKGLCIVEVPVTVRYFLDRKSRVAKNLFSYAWRILHIIFSSMRDYKPLKFFGFFGTAIFLVGAFLDVLILIHFYRTGAFYPYKSVGATGILFNLLGLAIIALGFVTDMLARIRMNQEKLMYYIKKNH